MDQGLTGHPRSVKLGSGDNKMRLYTSIRSKTPAIWQRGLHISSAGLVLFTGSKRCLLSHPDSSSAQAVLVIRFRGSGLSIYGPPLWAVPGSPHFYEVHGRGSFPAETDGNPHPELPRRLAHFGPVGGRVSISQIRAPQPLRVPRTLGQFCQDCAVPQPTNFFPGNSYRLNVSHQNLHWPFSSSRLHSNGVPRPLKAFQKMLGLMASASSVLHLGLLHMQPLQYWLKPRVPSQTPPCQGEPGLRCSSGPYKNHQWMERCMAPGHGLQKEGGLDRCLQLRLGGAVRQQTGFRPLVEEGRSPSHQPPGNAGSMFEPSHLSVRPEQASRLSTVFLFHLVNVYLAAKWQLLLLNWKK